MGGDSRGPLGTYNPKSGGADTGAGTDSRAGSPGSPGSQAGDPAGRGADSGAGAESVGGVESVGVVDGTEHLIREAEAAAAGAPVDPSAPGAAPLAVTDSWAVLMPPTVEVICGVVLPAWEIRAEEQRPLAEAMAECMEQIFPGGIDGKYGCWVRLITVTGAITVSRVATNGGKLPPLFLPKGSTRKSTPAPTPPAAVDPMTVTSLTE